MVGGIENEGESMPRTRKNHTPSLKAKVAVEAIRAYKTTAQIAQMFGVHPTQVGGWKKQALSGLPDLFGNGRAVAGLLKACGERGELSISRGGKQTGSIHISGDDLPIEFLAWSPSRKWLLAGTLGANTNSTSPRSDLFARST
jgi:transposase